MSKEYLGKTTVASLIRLIKTELKKYVKMESMNERIPAPKTDDNGKFVSAHQLRGQTRIADGFCIGFINPCRGRIRSDHRDLNAATGKRDLARQLHDGRRALSFLKNLLTYFCRESDVCTVC